jgi:TRAP-type mannitol/chloroaromatic compound transport system permease small subunit
LKRRGGGVFAASVRAIDRINEVVGRWTSWLVLSMVLTTFMVAVLRYGFELGWIWLQEIYVWMHGVIFMVAAGYTLLHDGHVRVDIFYRAASIRAKAWVNLVGLVGFLLPTLVAIWWFAWPYVLISWQRLEVSREAGGMHGLYLLKTAILVFCVLLALQGIALAVRSVFVLTNRRDPDETPEETPEGM